MSTPCVIFRDTPVLPKGIYCHYDGTLEHTGLTLYQHYNNEENVKALITKGDTPGIQPNIEDMGFYDKHSAQAGNIKDYHRVYLFWDGQWYVKASHVSYNRGQNLAYYDNVLFEPLEKALKNKHLI